MSPSGKFLLGWALAAAALACYACLKLFVVLFPFLAGFLIAYVSNPVINALRLRGLRRDVAVLAVYAAVAVSITLLVGRAQRVLAGDLQRLAHDAPLYVARIEKITVSLKERAARMLPLGADIMRHLNAEAYDPLIAKVQNIPHYLLKILPILTYVFLIPLIAFFALLDGPKAVDTIVQKCPSRYLEQFLHLIDEIDIVVGRYLKGLIIEASLVSMLVLVGLLILRVHYSVAISALAGLGCFVPYFGFLVAAIFGILAAAFEYASAWMAIKTAFLFLIVKAFDDTILTPLLPTTNLHPLVLVLSLMLGARLFDFGGLVLAVPVVCVLSSLAKIFWAWYAESFGLKAALPARQSTLTSVPYI